MEPAHWRFGDEYAAPAVMAWRLRSLVVRCGHWWQGRAGGDVNVSLGTDSKIETFATWPRHLLPHHGVANAARGGDTSGLVALGDKVGDVVTPGM